MTILNCTPHAICLVSPSGEETVIQPSGTVTRISTFTGLVVEEAGIPCLVASPSVCTEIVDLPDAAPETIIIVSGMVGGALALSGRRDVFIPGTGPNDGAVRNNAGQIIGVTRLIRTC